MTLVRSVTFFRPRTVLSRPDYVSFALAFAIQLSLITSTTFDLWLLATCGLLVVGVFSFLATSWSLRWKCVAQYERSAFKQADHVLVSAAETGVDMLVPLENNGFVKFTFAGKSYVVDSNSEPSPLDYSDSMPVAEFLKSTGLTSEEAGIAQLKYGKCCFNFPIPSFGELFSEQVKAPMFVFQTFCMLLFSLDDYWYFAIFTMVMLLFLEGIIVRTRLANLNELREIGGLPGTIYVFRGRRWEKLDASELVPGDVVALSRSEGSRVPADVILLGGSCIVNESMLTGEGSSILFLSLLIV